MFSNTKLQFCRRWLCVWTATECDAWRRCRTPVRSTPTPAITTRHRRASMRRPTCVSTTHPRCRCVVITRRHRLPQASTAIPTSAPPPTDHPRRRPSSTPQRPAALQRAAISSSNCCTPADEDASAGRRGYNYIRLRFDGNSTALRLLVYLTTYVTTARLAVCVGCCTAA